MVTFAFTKSIFTLMKTNRGCYTNGRHTTRNQCLACSSWTITPSRQLGMFSISTRILNNIEWKCNKTNYPIAKGSNFWPIIWYISGRHCGSTQSPQVTTIPNTKYGVVRHGNACKQFDLRHVMVNRCFLKQRSIQHHRILCWLMREPEICT